MQDRAHDLADRAEQRQRQTTQDQGPEAARQQQMRRDGDGLTQAEQQQLAAGQTTTYRRGR